MDLGLRGKRALVTGGSRGLGKAVAKLLALEGAEVAVTGRTLKTVSQSAQEITAAGGGKAIALTVELTDAQSVRRMVEKALEKLGTIDILINAGARVSGKEPEDFAHVTDEMILHDFDEKVLGSLRTVREVAPVMRKQGFGRIVNLSGSSARYAGGISAGARNTALVNLTKNLANELGPDGITVNCVYPGTTVTETFEDRMRAQAERRGVPMEEHIRHMNAQPAIRRLLNAEELAAVVVFLASPAAVGISGEAIAVTGGLGNAVFL